MTEPDTTCPPHGPLGGLAVGGGVGAAIGAHITAGIDDDDLVSLGHATCLAAWAG